MLTTQETGQNRPVWLIVEPTGQVRQVQSAQHECVTEQSAILFVDIVFALIKLIKLRLNNAILGDEYGLLQHNVCELKKIART